MAALTYLDLYSNHLEGFIPEFFGNMTSLTHLDLGGNHLEGLIPTSFGNMTAITFINLGGNLLEGSIPEAFGNMTTLEHLDLSHIYNLDVEISKFSWISMKYLDLDSSPISGPMPNFTLMPSLQVLRLSSTQLRGNVSKSIGQLSQLSELDISANFIEGVMSEAHFSRLFHLFFLNLSYNPGLVLNMSPDWNPPFQLWSIHIGSCMLGHFPKWIQTQKDLDVIEMPNSKISGCIPNTFWNFPAKLMRIDLSNNEIRGAICDDNQSGGRNISKSVFDNPSVDLSVDLSSNQLEGSIPLVLFEVGALNLSNNRLSELHSLCNVTKFLPLIFLDISYNQLSGELPDCWSYMKGLKILLLANNKLSGRIPVSIGSLTKIESLHLGNNSLIGELPSSLKKLRKLIVLDVAENNLVGPIPAWIGKSMKQIAILSLRSNYFNGSIPLHFCGLENLQVLDLSSNNLSSGIPTCLGNLSAMKESGSTVHSEAILDDYYFEELFEVWKGQENELKNLFLLKNMDLSSNKLMGEIPREITELVALVSLNLSRNNLSGQIPQEIGRLESLDVLDLSKNHLSGRIPSSLSQIDRLNTLDLSNNSLSGKIPTGTQLQARDAAAYMGNPELCGDPLPKCPGEENPTIGKASQEDQDAFISKGFFISAAAGFIVAFWGVCLTLIFVKSWRYRYFKALNNAGDWLYVTVAVRKAKLLRIIKS
ncbi:hypothetical protein TIFTF001_034550 [Ficus carica]|uniref:Uncharacterized protein n=1 Tax=Ficus carica TaxID=3494 RepID=A0AA88E1H5_FICCA|nr:hypothetical protein TIFTF001_034529 [Ficus carica]GMN65478.1 hypothetical protein TIFTF001_034550 [Ficus carica]